MNILITNSRSFLVAIALMFGVSAATGVYAQESGDKSKMDKSMPKPGKKDGDIEIPVLVMVPPRVSLNMMTEGCWAKLYDKENFQGDSLLLAGRINWPHMIGPRGYNWEGNVRSIETGPKANLTLYDNRHFQDQDVFIGAGKRVAELSNKMGFLDSVHSLMLSCI
ncbi:MAG: hypothetical protein L0H15_06860 [Nitrosospira sp.]|nr:hypothetical protein [Nitrosospira sp.]MDN5836607.1 hypothetical protein [Nitrosospira sp.]MDN5881145.1 hypothetical protein [Nitrosospira sp.]